MTGAVTPAQHDARPKAGRFSSPEFGPGPQATGVNHSKV